MVQNLPNHWIALTGFRKISCISEIQSTVFLYFYKVFLFLAHRKSKTITRTIFWSLEVGEVEPTFTHPSVVRSGLWNLCWIKKLFFFLIFFSSGVKFSSNSLFLRILCFRVCFSSLVMEQRATKFTTLDHLCHQERWIRCWRTTTAMSRRQ